VTWPDADSRTGPTYDRVSRAVHWLVAALAVIVITLGWAIGGAPRNTPSRDLLLLLHRSVGLVILAAMLFRVGWRWIHPAPAMPENNRLSQAAIAFHLVGQYLVYLFVALHVAGALRHAIVKRDGVLERMLPLPRASKS